MAGVPRFPSFLRIHGDARKANLFQEGDTNMPTTATTRRFEFVEGSSDKFYEVSTNDNRGRRPLRSQRHERPDGNQDVL